MPSKFRFSYRTHSTICGEFSVLITVVRPFPSRNVNQDKSASNKNKNFVWPFGELHQSSLDAFNKLLLLHSRDERVRMYIETIQLPSSSELKQYGV